MKFIVEVINVLDCLYWICVFKEIDLLMSKVVWDDEREDIEILLLIWFLRSNCFEEEKEEKEDIEDVIFEIEVVLNDNELVLYIILLNMLFVLSIRVSVNSLRKCVFMEGLNDEIVRFFKGLIVGC